MEKIEVTRFKEVTEFVYEAQDGRRFDSLPACEAYEKKLKDEYFKENLQPLLVDGFNMPPCDCNENVENDLYMWFRVENDADIKKLSQFYEACISYLKYPNYVCIELNQYGDVDFLPYWTTLDLVKEDVTEFFKKGFGITVEFKEG